ncbi:M13 family metallopeptidase [Teredinibacter waterburyi]|jgi:endothelin-converting enzyme (EC 3.4.24.71). Metallo peptidase. MEROPS family M13|uniref:M13 family metallopeptidase n=1 Tax=Teredinibacter waterburyi TaxID=1500538 RepID=UPI00165F9056|nr:M13 family metallopeptidase [Teredinibacter waterburyi]
MTLKQFFAANLLALAIVGCSQQSQHKMEADHTAQAQYGNWGIDLSGMDLSVAPGDDFHRYASGSWLNNYEIPADRARYGVFDILNQKSDEQVKAIIQELGDSDAKAGTLAQKVGDFYATWMDTDTTDQLGLTTLKPHFDKITAISSRADLINMLGSLHSAAPFGFGIIPDPADSSQYIVIGYQAGLGLPNRDYYLKQEQRFADYRSAYIAYITQMQALAGIDNAEQKAKAIFALEKQLAEVQWSEEDNRELEKIYNPMSKQQLMELAPAMDWNAFFQPSGLGAVDNLVIMQPSTFTASAELVNSVDLELWKDYLRFHFVNNHAWELPQAFEVARFDFYDKTLKGIEQQKPRWQRGADLINSSLGEAVGKIYLKRHFPPIAKTKMDELVENLREVLQERLANNDWMDAPTKKQALLKLSTFEPRIGYPTKWTDYSTLEIVKGDRMGNALRMTEFEWALDLKRLEGPVDRDEWHWPPQVVNASYNPLLNQLTFPAGILQAPFFDLNADPAVNYGAIGGVIGHEMGHGFDDQGRKFDERGRIRDWWTEESASHFKKEADKLVAQYNQYSPIEGMNVNGTLTLGENIGDLGGVEIAYAAFQRYKAEHGEPPVLDGLTGDQRFFLSWAHVWRAKAREEALSQQLLTDPHSPAQYRVNGVVRNIDAWYQAFNVGPDNALYLPPEERVSIW